MFSKYGIQLEATNVFNSGCGLTRSATFARLLQILSLWLSTKLLN